MDYPENHLCYDDRQDGGHLLMGLFPVVYDWEESAVIRKYALLLGLPNGEPMMVWVVFTNPIGEHPFIDADGMEAVTADSDGDGGEGYLRFSAFPDIDFTELRRYVIDAVLRGLPEQCGVDVTGVMSALDVEAGDAR